MSNQWHDYYGLLSLPDYLSNLHSHKELLDAIDQAGSGQKILEVGTGTGSMSIFLSQIAHHLTALDKDPQILELAKRHNALFGGRVEAFVEGDSFKLDFPDNHFDTVFHQGLFEHFSDQEIRALLTEQLRVGRRVVFSVPNNQYPRTDFGNERLMSLAKWQTIMTPFVVERAEAYCKKFFPRPYLIRAKIQNLFVITSQT